MSLFQRLRESVRRKKHRLTVRLCEELLSDVSLNSDEQGRVIKSLAGQLSKLGWTRYNDHEYWHIEEGIELMEQSWALCKVPDVACRLGLMYERANRNSDTTELYRQAFWIFPSDRQLRYQTAAHVLRHGSRESIQEFFTAVLDHDPSDPFSAFVLEVLGRFGEGVDAIVRSVSKVSVDGQPLILSFAVWGEEFIDAFMTHACAALLAPRNLPAVSREMPVHMAILTTAKSRDAFHKHPMFTRVLEFAKVHFTLIPDGDVDYKNRMVGHYGPDLGFEYGQNCKFVLFSSAHYMALEAGRSLDALVMPLGADNILCDGALMKARDVMRGPYDVLAVTGFRLYADKVEPIIRQRYRDEDGTIAIPPSHYAMLLADQIPENNYAASKDFTHFPLILCWRGGDGSVLVHSNHYHPCCLRASALRPLYVTTDPVDGRFLARQGVEQSRIYVVQDTDFALSDWGDSPLIVRSSKRPLSKAEISLWLWMYWDSLREFYFRIPIRIGSTAASADLPALEAEAQALLDEILSESLRRERRNIERRGWKRQA